MLTNHAASSDSQTVTPSPQCANLRELYTFKQYQELNAHIFPSGASLRWYYRVNRSELVEAGAVLEIAGRSFVHLPTFSRKILEIGARTAAARSLAEGQS